MAQKLRRREKLAGISGWREELTENVGRREIYAPVPLPSCLQIYGRERFFAAKRTH